MHTTRYYRTLCALMCACLLLTTAPGCGAGGVDEILGIKHLLNMPQLAIPGAAGRGMSAAGNVPVAVSNPNPQDGYADLIGWEAIFYPATAPDNAQVLTGPALTVNRGSVEQCVIILPDFGRLELRAKLLPPADDKTHRESEWCATKQAVYSLAGTITTPEGDNPDQLGGPGLEIYDTLSLRVRDAQQAPLNAQIALHQSGQALQVSTGTDGVVDVSLAVFAYGAIDITVSLTGYQTLANTFNWTSSSSQVSALDYVMVPEVAPPPSAPVLAVECLSNRTFTKGGSVQHRVRLTDNGAPLANATVGVLDPITLQSRSATTNNDGTAIITSQSSANTAPGLYVLEFIYQDRQVSSVVSCQPASSEIVVLPHWSFQVQSAMQIEDSTALFAFHFSDADLMPVYARVDQAVAFGKAVIDDYLADPVNDYKVYTVASICAGSVVAPVGAPICAAGVGMIANDIAWDTAAAVAHTVIDNSDLSDEAQDAWDLLIDTGVVAISAAQFDPTGGPLAVADLASIVNDIGITVAGVTFDENGDISGVSLAGALDSGAEILQLSIAGNPAQAPSGDGFIALGYGNDDSDSFWVYTSADGETPELADWVGGYQSVQSDGVLILAPGTYTLDTRWNDPDVDEPLHYYSHNVAVAAGQTTTVTVVLPEHVSQPYYSEIEQNDGWSVEDGAQHLAGIPPSITGFTGNVGPGGTYDGDSNDFFWFELNAPTQVTVKIDFDLPADLDLALLNNTGAVLQTSESSSNPYEKIVKTIGPGWFGVRVYSYNGTSDYELAVTH